MVRLVFTVGLLWIVAGCATSPEFSGHVLGDCRLVYSPMPQYPLLVRRAYFPLVGWGNYYVSFDASGHATSVKTIRTTRSDALDEAAISTLLTWRSEPGRPCNALVPIKFHPESPASF